MLGSKLARLPRPFVRQAPASSAINQNLRPKISNYATQYSVNSSGVQSTINTPFYFVPEAAK